MAEKIFLGKVKKDFKGNERNYVAGEMIYLTKHSWDCGWYWGFGYIGNKDLHTHFDSTFLGGSPNTAKEIFESPKFTDNEWWVIRDLMIQAYALKEAAAVYKHGGHQTTRKGITDIIQDADKENPKNKVETMEERLNKDLGKILDTLWDYMNHAIKNQSVLREEISLMEKETTKLEEKIGKLDTDKEGLKKELSGKKASLAELKGNLQGE